MIRKQVLLHGEINVLEEGRWDSFEDEAVDVVSRVECAYPIPYWREKSPRPWSTGTRGELVGPGWIEITIKVIFKYLTLLSALLSPSQIYFILILDLQSGQRTA